MKFDKETAGMCSAHAKTHLQILPCGKKGRRAGAANTSLPGSFFFPMSAQDIPGEFSSRLHLRSQGADVRAGQWKDTGGWLAGQGPEGGVAPCKQVWKNQFPSKPAPGCESASCYATLEYFQTTWLTPEQWHFSVRVPERGIPLERVCVFVRSRTSACLSHY